MWRYHAVHHSSEELEWISAARFHPVNLFLGSVIGRRRHAACRHFAQRVVVLGPLTIAHSAFVHANLDWTLGPFKYVIATPVFHRWHHTAADRGGEKNFAATFPVLDLLFGTFYMPKGELPDRYGIAERESRRAFRRSWCTRSRSERRPSAARAAAHSPIIVKQASPTAMQVSLRLARFALHSRFCSQVNAHAV